MAGRDEFFSRRVAVNSTNGTGTTTDTQRLRGILLGFYIDYHASAAAGSDLTIKAVTPAGYEITLLTLTDVNTDGYYTVAMPLYGPTGALTGLYQAFVFCDCLLNVTIASDGGSGVRTDAVIVEALLA